MPSELKSVQTGLNRFISVQHTTEPTNQQPAFTRDQFKHFICTINVLNLISYLYFSLFTHVTSWKILVRGFSNKTQLLEFIILATSESKSFFRHQGLSNKLERWCKGPLPRVFTEIFDGGFVISSRNTICWRYDPLFEITRSWEIFINGCGFFLLDARTCLGIYCHD